MIEINFVDNNYISVDSDDDFDFLYNICDEFTFYAEGFLFHPLYKQKRWDGKIRLFNTKTKLMKIGLLDRLMAFISDNGKSASIDKRLLDKNNYLMDDVNRKIEALNFHSNKKPIKFKSYQKEAVHVCLNEKRKLIESPTSSGKSAIIAAICRILLDDKLLEKEKILIVVPTINLVTQFKNDFYDYFSEDRNWIELNDIHTICGGASKRTFKRIVISTYQSIAKESDVFFNEFGCLIIDECHKAKAKSLTTIREKCLKADYIFGFTGSLKKQKETLYSLEANFSSVFTTTTLKEMMDNNEAAQLDIKILNIKHSSDDCKKISRISDYQSEVDFIISNEKRNMLISKLATKQKGNGLILVSKIDSHIKPLYNLIKANTDRPVFLIIGDTPLEERERIRSELKNYDNAIILANYQILSTGVNIPSLAWLIFGSSLKAYETVMQSIGRILRLYKNKSSVRLIDLVDDLREDKKPDKHNYLYKHFLERLDYYKTHQLKYDISTIILDKVSN